MRPQKFDEEAAIGRLMRFLAVEGVTGEEKAIGQEVVGALLEAGVPRKAITFDNAHERIPLPTQTGNLIVRLSGTVAGPTLMLMTHLDTVPLCAGAVPVRERGRIRPAGKTALGGDNRVGVACLVTLAATILEQRLPHPPLTLLFTVREESGLWGARYVDLPMLGKPLHAFNIDGGTPDDVTIGAVGADRWQVEIEGRASHAGAHPERGISATMVVALALAEIHRHGWFGSVKHNGKEGTSNVGVVAGANGTSVGAATNVVTDYALVRGESRSHNSSFIRDITRAYRDAFRSAAARVNDDRGRKARVKFEARRDYYPFRLSEGAPVVKYALEAGVRAGLEPAIRVTRGGLDANWMVRHGIPTITFGAGQHNAHTTEEYVELKEFLEGCRFALALVTA
jgi:tripeptide aminopeptidase